MKIINPSKEFASFAKSKRNIPTTQLDAFHRYQVENLTPNIIEERPMNIAVMDVYSRLMMDRIIFLGYPISDEIANIVIAQLLFLDSSEPGRDIQLYINSPGGSVYGGLGIYDTLQYIKSEVATICIGVAASMGAVLLASGAASKRTALQHSRIMIHQPSGAIGGQASDISITIRQMKQLRSELYEILAKQTGKTTKQIENDCERDYWLSSLEAKEYGLVDQVLSSHLKKATK